MRLSNLVQATSGLLLLALLSGCIPSAATTPPAPTATFVAPYATDEEALAAAEAAYAEYSRVADEIFSDSGSAPERLSSVAVGSFLELSVESFENFARDGNRRIGVPIASGFVLQRYSPSTGPREIITVYLCRNVSNVDVVDRSGISIVVDGRPDRSTMQVTFDLNEEDESLLVSDQQLWESGNC